MKVEKENQTGPTAENAEVMESTAQTVKLKRPILFDGQTVESIVLDFESLTGADIEQAETQFTAENPQNAATTPMKEMSKGFQAIVAARAAKKPVALIRQLAAPDYSKVTAQTMLFLLNGE